MPVDTEALLEESGWVRALARSLAADRQRAEDLAQDTLLAALQRPRAEGVPLRRWLAAVMRNLWNQERRGELRRGDREVRAARGEVDGAEPTPDLVARLEGHRAIVDAVLALHEPYRSVLVARYFDGLAPRAIAQRTGLPVRTVHTQLARALSLLRARLERSHGDAHGAWLPILGLLMGSERSGSLVGTTLGALAMDVKVKLGLGIAAVAGLAFVARPLWNGARPSEAPRAAVSAAVQPVAAPEQATSESPEVAAESVVEREAVRAVPQPELHSEPAPVVGLRVRVIDTSGVPVAGIALRCSESGEVVRTDDEGVVEAPCEAERATFEVADERWTLAREPFGWNRTPGARNELVVAPRLHLAGRVVDEAGTPLAGAQVRVFLPLFGDSGMAEPLGASRTRTWTTESDAEGAFELDAGVLPGGMLVARHVGHRTDLGPQPTLSESGMEIVLPTLEPGDDLLGGLVVDESGVPVEGARVALGFEHTRSDASGRFLIHLPERDERGVLMALAPGRLPARLERAAPNDRDPGAWPDPLILRLGGPPLAISGRVVDASGEPVAGAEVSVLDPTPFGSVEWEGVEGVTLLGFAESLLAGQPSRTAVETDADGNFVIEGLLPRAYELGANHARSLRSARSGAVEAGVAGLVLRLPDVETRPLVAGRVLGLDGEPIVGANVALRGRSAQLDVADAEAPIYRQPLYGASTRTDEEGGFRFEGVPLAVAELQVDGPGLVFGQTFALSEHGDPEALELRAARNCKLEIDLTDSGVEADRALVLDGEGEALVVAVHLGDALLTSERASLREGKSGTISVSERARTLVLMQGEGEVLRLPLRLDPGRVTPVRP